MFENYPKFGELQAMQETFGEEGVHFVSVSAVNGGIRSTVENYNKFLFGDDKYKHGMSSMSKKWPMRQENLSKSSHYAFTRLLMIVQLCNGSVALTTCSPTKHYSESST